MKDVNKKYKRKDFIRLAALGGLGIITNACNNAQEKKPKQQEVKKLTPEVATIDTSYTAVNEGDVIYYKKGDAIYETLRTGFNKRIEKYPAIIALCKTTAGVAVAIKYAVQNKLPIAVKSGGHCFEGFSSNNDGMMINLSQLNKVAFINDNLVRVQPGCNLSQLYDVLLPAGKIIPAGSCGSVGIGGLTLGGGYGLFSRKYGLTCDSLAEVTMIDGQGNLRSSKDDTDLLWACKGGGNGNFGIVTELVFKIHDAPLTFQSHRFKSRQLDAQKANSILEKWFEVSAGLPLSCFSAFVLNGKTLNILLTNYEQHNNDVQNAIEQLSTVMDKTTIGKPIKLATALKNYYGIQYPIYFKNASAGLYKGYGDIKNVIEQVLNIVIETPGMIYQVNTLGGKISDAEFEKSSSYPHRSLPFLAELQTYWEEEKKGVHLMEMFQEIQSIFTGAGMKAQYCNYPDLNFSDYEYQYFGNSYSKLQKIKGKYDPNNFIRHDQGISRGITVKA